MSDPPKRRWYQFRRRTLLLVVMLVSSVAVGWTVFEMTRSPVWTMKLPGYHGMTRERVLEELGKPHYREDLTVEQLEDEFHGELEYHLDSQITYRDDQTAFVEWRWRDGEYHIALWFRDVEGEWIVVDSLRWHESIRF